MDATTSLTNTGGALSTFDKNIDQYGIAIKNIFEYQILGVTLDDAINLLEAPTPKYIKIDVDGIEHFILHGGENVLQKVDSVLVEINDNFHEQAKKSAMYLINAGLTLHRKNDIGVAEMYNQWWIRGSSSSDQT